MKLDELLHCFTLLTRRQSLEWFIVLAFSILSATMELVGVAAVIPVVSLLVDYSGSLEYRYILQLYKLLGSPEKPTFLLIVFLSSSFLILLASTASIINLYLQNRYSRRVVAELSAELFRGYLKTGIDFFHKRTAADLIRAINDVPADITHNIIINIIHLLSRVWLLIIIFLLLILINPTSTLFIIFIISICYILIFKIVRVYIVRNYRDNFFRQRILHQLLINAVNSIKQIKVDNLIDLSAERYRDNKKAYARQEANIEIVGAIPRHLIESIGVITLLIVAYRLGIQERSTNVMVSQLTFFAIAAYRILPSAQQIYHGFNRIVGSLAVYNQIREEWHAVLNIEENTGNKIQSQLTTIQFEGVNYRYPETEKNILSDFSCTINLQEVTVIDGKSGAGKTTLLELLIGLRRPEYGRIVLDNHDLSGIKLGEWWKKLSYCDQKHILTRHSVRDNILANDKFIQSRYQTILTICGIDERDYDQKLQQHEATKSLSGGEQARVSIARSLYKDSKVVIFDEAFAALDVSAAREIFKSILHRFPDRGYIIVSHRKEELELVANTIRI